MKSEYTANEAMQTKHIGASPIVYKQGKYATIGTMLQSYLTKFAALYTLALTIKYFSQGNNHVEV